MEFFCILLNCHVLFEFWSWNSQQTYLPNLHHFLSQVVGFSFPASWYTRQYRFFVSPLNLVIFPLIISVFVSLIICLNFLHSLMYALHSPSTSYYSLLLFDSVIVPWIIFSDCNLFCCFWMYFIKAFILISISVTISSTSVSGISSSFMLAMRSPVLISLGS